ncbi:MAG: hypothetical protein C5B54_11805 [Acidobacteria bacterium]|nr:MAG: hypothetical protein C5B54_11805 [Acidobacteriota bacterium]
MIGKVPGFVCALVLLCNILPAVSSDFSIQKQKLKLSLEYENFVDTDQDEITTSGFKATYLLHAQAKLADKMILDLDYQTGAKTNFYRHFNAGDLSALIWSNRANATVTVPFRKAYLSGTFYFSDKLFSEVPPENQFVDIFGGVGFRQFSGAFQAGYRITPLWEISGGLQASDTNFDEFDESNSNWRGASLRLTRKIGDIKINGDYRFRSIDYNRPVTLTPVPLVNSDSIDFQHDRLQELGVNVEFYRTVYFSGGYSYQINDSNNPGFTYRNHRITFLIGTELTHDFHLQAYGILQLQSFLEEDVPLEFPIVLDENDNNTMAASLVKMLGKSREIEIGLQRYVHNSSFTELNASKYILYVAYNFRF